MRSKIQKWGNSLAVRIPKSAADKIGLKEQDAIDVVIEGDRVVILPVLKIDGLAWSGALLLAGDAAVQSTTPAPIARMSLTQALVWAIKSVVPRAGALNMTCTMQRARVRYALFLATQAT